MSKLSPDVLAMMSPDTTSKAEAQELYRPSELTAPRRMSLPSNARNTNPDTSVSGEDPAGGLSYDARDTPSMGQKLR